MAARRHENLQASIQSSVYLHINPNDKPNHFNLFFWWRKARFIMLPYQW